MSTIRMFASKRFLIFLIMLLPRQGQTGGPDEAQCARFAVSPREETMDRHRAAELRAALDEAASFVGADPDAFRRCPNLAGSLRALAAGLIEVGEFTSATVACDLMGRGSPLRGEDLLLCARPALRGGRIAEARRLLSAFVDEAGPDPAVHAEAVLRAAEVLEEAARYREAAEFLDLGLHPEAPGKLILREIHNLLRIGDGEASRKVFQRATRRPDLARDRTFLREVCLLFARYGENGLARLAASLLVVVPNLGEIEADTVVLAAEAAQDPVLAERAAQRFIEDAGTPEARPDALRIAIAMLDRHGFTGSAARLLEDGLRNGTLSGAEDQVWFARLLIREGRVPEAHQVLDRLVGMGTTSPQWDRLADLWTDADGAMQAVVFLKRHEDVSDPGWVLALGRALHHAGQDHEEMALYEAAANRLDRAGAYDFWRKVGSRYRDREDLARARDAFRHAVRVATSDPQRAHARLDIAETYLKEEGGPDRRKTPIESEVLAAMEVGGDDPSVRSRIEQITERIAHSPVLSLALLEAAVRREPARPDLWRRLATAHLRARRPKDAVEDLRRFVRTAPEPGAAVGEALSVLLDAERFAEAIYLLVYFENTLGSGEGKTLAAFSPEMSRRIGMACAILDDRLCVSRYLAKFLDAPIQPEADYLECARTLARFGLWTLAWRAIEKASKTLPPDLAWEVEFAAGEVALASSHIRTVGRGGSLAQTDDAEAHFQKALATTPQRRDMVERIAQAYEAAGRWRDASRWWKRAVDEQEGAARLRAFGRLLASLVRQDEIGVTRDMVKQVFPETPEGLAAWTLMESLANVGLTGEAVEIARKIMGLATLTTNPSIQLPPLDGLDPNIAWPWLTGLFLDAGRTDEALQIVHRVCQSATEDSVCLAVSKVVAERSLPREALVALQSRCRHRECDFSILVQIASIRMRLGDRAEALTAASQAAKRCDDADAVLEPLGPLFRNARAYKEYLELLEILRGRREFEGDPDVALEMARALLGTGDIGGTLLVVSAYLGTGRGREAEVYRLLAEMGLRDEAARILLESPLSSIEKLGFDDLREIVVDLERTGRMDVVDRLLDRIRRSDSEGFLSEPIARILAALGRNDDANAAFERMDTDRLSPEAGIEWVQSLWRSGDRRRAFAIAQALAGRGMARGEDAQTPSAPRPGSVLLDKVEVPSACRPLVGVFLEEEAVAEAWTLYQACVGPGEPARELESSLALEMVRSGDERFLVPAREIFVQALLNARVIRQDLVEFIRTEVVRGRALDLIRELKAWGTSRTLLEARTLTACLAGQAGDMAAAIQDLSGAPGEPDPRGLLAAARALLMCGRFREAHWTAMEGLRVAGPTGPLWSLARVAVRSGLAAGLADTPRAVEAFLRSRIEDRARLHRLIARVRRDGGDWTGSAEALFQQIAFVEPDHREKARFEAFRAALMAGDRDLAARVGDLIIAGAKDRTEAVLSLAALSSRHLRDEMAVPWLTAEQARWPGDPRIARTALEARLRSGSEDGVTGAAMVYVRALGDHQSAWAEALVLAATNLRLDLVEEGLRHLQMGEADDGVANALLRVGIAFLMVRDDARGRDIVIRGAMHARDPRGFLARLAEAAIEDPNVPEDLLDEAVRALGSLKPGDADPLPLVRVIRCLTDDAPPGCMRELRFYGQTVVLLSALRKALLSGRDRTALALIGAIHAMDASRATALQTAATLVSTSWPVRVDRHEVARILGLAVREVLARTGTRTLTWYPALEAHLADLVDGPGAGLSSYQARISIAPAEAEVRNNLAYYLSVGGLDIHRALREVRLAVALSSRGHAYYLETEAWAEFLRGETRRALALQERARNLWRLDQGGGLAESFLHLGRMYEATGRAGDAREAYRRAAVLEPMEAAGVEALRRFRDLARPTKTEIDLHP